MPNIDLSILNQRQTPAFFADTLANRPAAGFLGRIFVSTDTFAFYRDNGTGWDLIGGPGTGTITGTGASGQIALWNGASTITGDTGLTYDGTANSLTADKFVVSGGTSSQFLKGDGSLDNNTYLTSSALTGYVPYTSATANVDLGSFDLTADLITGATGSFTSSGGSNTFGITHSSGSGIALNISKDGNGEGLIVTKGSGSGNAATINGGLVRIENNSGDAQLQLVSSTAPSLRIDNASTGATQRIGLGLATAVNNFIQGTTGGELCLFNSSTTASPILFGVYDAGLTNTQEAARISASRNLLVGTSVDAGQRLQITGNSLFTGNIGIKTNPDTFLDIGSYGSAGNYINEPSLPNLIGQYLINLSPPSTFQYYGGGIGWSEGTNTAAGINVFDDGANGALGLSFSTGNNSALIQRFIIDSSGNSAFYGQTNIINGAINFGGSSVAGSTDPAIYRVAGNSMVFANNSSEVMRIPNTGNLLIGTTTDAGQKLQVAGVIYANGAESNSVYLGSFLFTPGTYTGFRQGTDQSFNIDTYNGGTVRNPLKITQAGYTIIALPTSSSGLPSGALWNNGGVVNVAP